MSKPSQQGRRLISFRLSDVPTSVRMAAAHKCATRESKVADDPLEAVFESLKIEKVALDPVEAALTMPTECENKVRMIPEDEWRRVCGKPP